MSPVRIEGRGIAQTFWGKAWCENLESYSDYENRLPRGRTYARMGRSILAAQRIAANFRYLTAVLALQGGPPEVTRMKTFRGRLPGIYPDRS